MHFKLSITAALLLATSVTAVHAAPTSAPAVVSPVVTILNNIPVVGSVLTGAVGFVGSATSIVPVVGPSLGNVLGAPALPGLPNVARFITQVPVAGATLSNLTNVAGTVVVNVPVLGPVLSGVLNGSTDLNGALSGLPSPSTIFFQLPVVGPLLGGKLLGGQ